MDVLLEEWSPVCSIQAVVEDNGQAVYFYLWVNPGSENAEIRNCWICNRVPAMEDMDYEAMKMGMAPRMPRAYVTHDSEASAWTGKNCPWSGLKRETVQPCMRTAG